MKKTLSYAGKSSLTVLFILWASILFSLPLYSGNPEISFTVRMDDAVNHIFRVEMTMRGIEQDYTVLKMPVWTPGYYKIEDYPKNLSSLTAYNGCGDSLAFEKTAKNIWKINTKGATNLKVCYNIYADSHSVAESFIDTTHAYIAPASLFLYPEGKISTHSEITFIPFRNWKSISTGLDMVRGKTNTFYAADFDILFDSPVLLGNQEVISFEVKGVPHYIAVLIPGDYNRNDLASDYKKMVESAVSIIGDIPYKHYTFLIMGKGGGGLEHINSQAVFTGFHNSDIYPKERREFNGWMSFIAHEFFHLYNVKTIRPIALGPFDYDKENYTNMLWVSEGFTVYYENIILNRAGFMAPDEMLEALSGSISAYESIPGSKIQSVTMSSFDAWINFFNFSESAQKTTISYYDKGCGLALLLDLKIRHETNNEKTLDDVMRKLYYSLYKEKGRGFTDAEFREECEKAAGCDLSEVFTYASTTIRPDYDKYLDYAGLYLKEGAPVTPGGKYRYLILRKTDITGEQKKIFNDMFRPLEKK